MKRGLLDINQAAFSDGDYIFSRREQQTMILEEIIARVQYPDRTGDAATGRYPYNSVAAFLKHNIEAVDGQLKIDLQETLTELEQRQKERQQIQFLFEINRHTVKIKERRQI